MRIDELLNHRYEDFSENEKYVCHFLTSHYAECCAWSVDEFARRCGVSKTLLVRFAKKLGLSGYSELKARIKLEIRESAVSPGCLLDALANSYHKMMDDLLKKDLSGLCAAIFSANRVFAFGSGSSQARAASEMKRIFLPAKEIIHLHGHDMCLALQKTAGPDDLVFIISLSGESEVVTGLARALITRHVPTVSITRLKSNTLASLCDENLYINSVRLPVEHNPEYETTTPYFILIEFLYLLYENYLQRRGEGNA